MSMHKTDLSDASEQVKVPMPVLFLGHGSPMNAIEENSFVKGFRKAGRAVPKPKAILCISAHWETRGTKVTAMDMPKTIHDFGGFPEALYKVQYPAPGSPSLAKRTGELISNPPVEMDHQWGLDHGAWSVIKHMFPEADVPVIQMSLNVNMKPAEHFEMASQLMKLREEGVLIVGSGNMVHNLGKVAWEKLQVENYGYDWALDASRKMKEFILDGNHKALINYEKQGKEFNLSVPTPEHFIPLLYVLALKGKDETVSLFNDKAVGGSITMTSVFVGQKLQE
jgi:4,5-DOPA dioxygenase extradiol